MDANGREFEELDFSKWMFPSKAQFDSPSIPFILNRKVPSLIAKPKSAPTGELMGEGAVIGYQESVIL